MSFQAMTWAVKQKVGNATGKAILLMLANYADDAGTCFPGQGKLAAECECSERTVREWLSKFEEMGIVRRDERRRTDGYRTSDAIILTMRSPASPAAEISPAAFSPENSSPENPSDLTGSSCRAITSQVNHQKSKQSERARRKDPTPVQELCRVLSEDRAKAVVEHRQRLRKPMTAHAASLLAKQFEACPNPDAAADTMIANGWQGFKPEWIHEQTSPGAPREQRDTHAAAKRSRQDDIAGGVSNFYAAKRLRQPPVEGEQADRPQRPAHEHPGQFPGREVTLERGTDGAYRDGRSDPNRYGYGSH